MTAPMTALRRHRALARIWASDPGWGGWFTTVNHSDIGRMFLAAAVFFFFVGGILAMLIRAQLATPRSPFMGPEIYNQIFTMHGTIMMFCSPSRCSRGWRSICCQRCWARAILPFRA